jgi:WD40 repeat protein
VWRLFGGRSHGSGAAELGSAGPKVFLSYAHESDTHSAEVHRLHDLLAVSGVTPVMDVSYAGVIKDWALWCRNQIDLADWVLVVASAAYKRRADSPEQLPEDEGRGVYWEARYIRGIVYSSRERANKIVPVLLPGGSAVHLPNFFTPDPDAVLSVPELSADSVAELADTLLGRRPLPMSLSGRSLTGWVYGGMGAGRIAAERVREHIVLRGRGHRLGAQGGDLFRGRAEARNAVIGWLQAEKPAGRVLVVVGQPGAGKSAVVARVVLDLELAAVDGWQLGLVFHARAATLSDFLYAMAVATHTQVAETVSGLEERLEAAAAPPGGMWRVVVDALDEAASDNDRNEIAQALTRLASLPTVRVVVAARALSRTADPGTRFAPGALLPRLGVRGPADGNLVDLDTDRFFDRAGVEAFAEALLAQDGAAMPVPPGASWSAYRADSALCARLAGAIAARADRNYLVAALTADLMSRADRPVDPHAPGFRPESMPGTIGDALTKYLERVEDRRGMAKVAGLLTALGYARGEGVPDGRWLRFADALGYAADTIDLDVLRAGGAADFLLETAMVAGGPVTRLFHQALVDELLASRDCRHDEARILRCLLPGESSPWPTADGYRLAHTAEHAAAAGRLPELLADPGFPLVADLARLAAVLPSRPTADLDPLVKTLRTASPTAFRLSPDRRARLFSLAAAQLGYEDLSRQFQGSGRPRVKWAHSRGTAEKTFAGHGRAVNSVAIGQIAYRDVVVTGSGDYTIQVWDAIGGQPVGDPLEGHTREVLALALGRICGSEVIVSAGNDSTLRRWDAVTGELLSTMPGVRFDSVLLGCVDGREVTIAGGRETSVFDAASDELLLTVPGCGVALGRVGEHDVIATSGAKAQLWDAVTGQPFGEPMQDSPYELMRFLMMKVNYAQAVAVGRVDGIGMVVTGHRDGALRRWDAVTGDRIGRPMTGHEEEVNSIVLARVGERDLIVSGSSDHTVRMWDAVTGQPAGQPLAGHTDRVTSTAVGWVSDRAMIVSGSWDATARMWELDMSGGYPLAGHDMEVTSVATGQLGGRSVVVSGSLDRTLRMWDPVFGEPAAAPLHTYDPGAINLGKVGMAVLSVATSRIGSQGEAVCGLDDGAVQVWDLAAGRPIASTPWEHAHARHAVGAESVVLGQAGNRTVIVSGGQDGRVKIWDALTCDHIRTLSGRKSVVRSVALGRVGGTDIIVSASGNRLRVWDAVKGRTIGPPLRGHTAMVLSVALGRVADRDVIVSGGADGTARLWNAATGQPLAVLSGDIGAVLSVTMGRLDGAHIVACGCADSTVRLWDAVNCAEIAILDTLDPVEALTIDDALLIVASGAAIVAYSWEGLLPLNPLGPRPQTADRSGAESMW